MAKKEVKKEAVKKAVTEEKKKERPPKKKATKKADAAVEKVDLDEGEVLAAAGGASKAEEVVSVEGEREDAMEVEEEQKVEANPMTREERQIQQQIRLMEEAGQNAPPNVDPHPNGSSG